MSNMSYCRMENTYNDLRDCLDNWYDTTSERELKFREKIIVLAHEIAKDNPGDDDDVES